MTAFDDPILCHLDRIATALETLCEAVDREKGVLKMVDVDRAKVYSTHLGGKLKPEEDK